MKKIIISLALLMLIVSAAYCAGTGTSSAAILKITPGPKPASMGNASIALSDDVNAIYLNPAGLAKLKSSEALFVHNDYIAGISYNYTAAAFKTKYVNCGASLMILDSGRIPQTIVSGLSYTQLGEYNAKDMVAQISCGVSQKKFDWGVAVKIIQQRIAEIKASTFAMDAGAKYFIKTESPIMPDITIAATVCNFGNDMKFETKNEKLPLTYKGGFGFDFKAIKGLKAEIDFSKPNDNDVCYNVGAEYAFDFSKGGFALRAGYDSSNDADNGFTTGISIKFNKLIFKDVQLDYSFVPYGDLDDAHRMGLSFKF